MCNAGTAESFALTVAVNSLMDAYYSSSAYALDTDGECHTYDVYNAAPTAASLAIYTAFAVAMLN